MPKKKEKAEYEVITLADGSLRYQFDVDLGYNSDGSRNRTTIREKTIKEGRKKVANLILGKKNISSNTSVLFETAFDNYIYDCIKKGMSPVTIQQKRYFKDKYLKKFFKIKMSKLNENDITKWKKNLSKNYANTTQRKMDNQLSAFLNWCVKKKIISTNPYMYLDKTKVKIKEMDFWTLDEFNQFINTIDDQYLKLIFTTLFYTGMRKSELFAICEDDIIDGEIHVRHSVKYLNNKIVIMQLLKSDSSNRIIPLPRWLKLKNNCVYQKKHYIFNPTDYLHITRVSKRYMQKAEVKIIRIHDFRHSYAAMLIDKGIDIYTLKELMGHKDIKITMNTYGHLYPDKRRKVRDLL